ncbi:PREDICTED: late embryogenesis abundant protein 47-like isoform X2 [Lupinus angustifolius]|uniref:late embryogenesis abundant protein 47-like isoform X2 n=1 Tax=Lupinus angustifolius TaxID=3871 RepID=UPI00092FA6EC|nr:PREDICTED: late embryogenesis abundant protein 47-like isoform X2 [Lupinus angustifolius]
MSQEQPQRPEEKEAIKDAAMMQKAENAKLGMTQKGGAAAAMQSAATKNEKSGVVGHNDTSKVASDGISETIAGKAVHKLEGKERKICKLAEVVEQFSQKVSLGIMTPPSVVEEMGIGGGGSPGITIGEALEATALTAGKKPVEWSDAAAIQAAEVRATGRTNIVPGGVAAAAQSAATLNARLTKDEEKTKLGDILADATSKLPSDRPATRRDAEGVVGAELRNDPYLTTHPGGVSASVAAAARLNQTKHN